MLKQCHRLPVGAILQHASKKGPFRSVASSSRLFGTSTIRMDSNLVEPDNRWVKGDDETDIWLFCFNCSMERVLWRFSSISSHNISLFHGCRCEFRQISRMWVSISLVAEELELTGFFELPFVWSHKRTPFYRFQTVSRSQRSCNNSLFEKCAT